MTEDILDALRPLASRAEDETNRFVRSLKGSSAPELQVREHLANALDVLTKADRILNPPAPVVVAKPVDPVEEPEVIDRTERAVAPAFATRRLKGGRSV